MILNVEKFVVMHIGANNNFYTYNMNNATLKQLTWREIWVIINKNGKYLKQYLMAAKK